MTAALSHPHVYELGKNNKKLEVAAVLVALCTWRLLAGCSQCRWTRADLSARRARLSSGSALIGFLVTVTLEPQMQLGNINRFPLGRKLMEIMVRIESGLITHGR